MGFAVWLCGLFTLVIWLVCILVAWFVGCLGDLFVLPSGYNCIVAWVWFICCVVMVWCCPRILWLIAYRSVFWFGVWFAVGWFVF